MDRGVWRATVHEVTKSWTQLKRLSMHVYSHLLSSGENEKRNAGFLTIETKTSIQ